MKIPIIKALAEKYEAVQLQEAENALMEGREPAIEIEGEDEGEKLTHVMAALWVKRDMEENETDIRTALRNYSVKVRNSIG